MERNEKKICCICGAEFEGWGNNPEGAMWKTSEGDIVDYDNDFPYNSEDRCCDECNERYVIPGRLYKLYH